MKTIPIYINNVSLKIEISLPDNVTSDEYISTVSEIKDKLGSMGEGALVDALTKITPGTSIESVTISGEPHKEEQPMFNKPSTVPASQLDAYVLQSGKYAGKMLQHCPPEELLMLLDMAAYTLCESDQDAIRGLRKTRLDRLPREEPQFEIPSQPAHYGLDDDDIPF